MKLNNKGFAISTIMYMILVLAVLVMALTLTLLNGRKLIIDKQKKIALNNIYEDIASLNLFPVVFAIPGECQLNGYNGNITGTTCVNSNGGTYYTTDYIDTGIKLFDTTNWEKDFEIAFTLVHYNAGDQTPDPVDNNNQHTILNSKFEDSSAKYPGFTFRRSTSGIELTSRNNEEKSTKDITYSDNMTVRIIRKDKKVYYSVNGASFTPLQDFTNLYRNFDIPVWFGATSISGAARRKTVCTLSNIYIKLGTMSNSYVELP